jgi:hypothetical protein
VRFLNDPKNKVMNIISDGTGKAALGKPEDRMSATDFKAKTSEIVNLPFQYQLDHL